jgi:hypothetical protein
MQTPSGFYVAPSGNPDFASYRERVVPVAALVVVTYFCGNLSADTTLFRSPPSGLLFHPISDT